MKIVDATDDFHENHDMSSRISKFHRDLRLSWVRNPVTGSGAGFLWGPRQTGKTTLLHQELPTARFYDLLDPNLSAELSVRPGLLREQVLADGPDIVVIDEVQKIPALLDVVHGLLENTSTRFILCGSSARKLRRKAGNLLGGRAIEFHLFPLTSHEIPDLDLIRLCNHGGLPAHYLVDDPAPLLRAYVNSYIKEEIIDEAATRNIPAFTRFVQVVALTHGQQMNFASMAREVHVSSDTIRNYFGILEDTLLGFTLEPWRKARKRRLSETAKFYLFDIGVANFLNPESAAISEGTDLFGRAFEHFVLNDIRAYLAYNQKIIPLSFWRTHSGLEVDLILGNLELALEFKSSQRVRDVDLKGMRALRDEHTVRRSIVVSREANRRKTPDGIEILFWREFCDSLWKGEII